MNVAKPQISVILPVYNASRFLAQAIESILSQTFSDFELIIINDGSTDDSQTIIDSFKDSRISAFAKQNTGLIDTLNFGISQSKSDWIARMDADDVATSARLATQIKHIGEGVAVIGSQAFLIDENAKEYGVTSFVTSHQEIVSKLEEQFSNIIHPTVLINKKMLLEVGGYDPKMHVAEDFDLWLRISKVGKLINVDKPLLMLRKHLGNISKTKLNISIDNSWLSLAYHFKFNSSKIMSDNDYHSLSLEVNSVINTYKKKVIALEFYKEKFSTYSPFYKYVYLVLRPDILFTFFSVRFLKSKAISQIKKL